MIFKEEAYQIVGGCIEVQNRMGCGFLEAVYQECLEIEFAEQGIPSISQPKLELEYRERKLRQTYQPDFVCFGKILVEIKAVSSIQPEHRAQLLNYLNATKFELGLLVNFGSPRLQWERLANTKDEQTPLKIRAHSRAFAGKLQE